MVIVIIVSLTPLVFKTDNNFILVTDKITVVIFIFDYISRWITADFYFKKKEYISFLRYPITPFAIIDLLSILPSVAAVNTSLKVLRISRILRPLRVVRVFKIIRYSKNLLTVISVLKKERDSLIAVFGFATGYIFLSALIIFNVEPDSFNTFFDAIYWATVSLTTMGYGDIYPVTFFGRIITMISAFFGIAIVALPASIITAGYMNEIQVEKLK